jgi:hypothetical protein
MSEDSSRLLYVYGFVSAGAAAGAAGVPGPEAAVCPGRLSGGIEENHAPFFQCAGRVAAVVSHVAQAEFCGPAGEANLQDLAWLAPRACRHQAVLEQAMRRGPVWPARFGTLFSGPASLAAFLRKQEAVIAPFLHRVAGLEEWAVKGFFDQARAEADWLARHRTPGTDPASVAPGAAYLREQRLRAQARQALDDWLAGICENLLQEMSPLASEIVPRRILAAGDSPAAPELVLNWALLLAPAAAGDFQARIRRANAEHNPAGLAFEVTGPWPPYSFCPALEPGPEADAG